MERDIDKDDLMQPKGIPLSTFTFHIPCTGAEAAAVVAGRKRVRMTRGRDCYHPESRTVLLSEETWRGTDALSVYCALHEAAHARQHIERPLWFSLRHVRLARFWIEWDAWRRAGIWLRDRGWETEGLRDERNKRLRTYA